MALMTAAVGGAAFRVFEAGSPLRCVTTEFTLAEAKKKLPLLIERYEREASVVYEMLESLPVTVYGPADYVSHLAEASRLLSGRDREDVELLALALKLNVPVWSNDRDFGGLPVLVYPTAVLLKILESESGG
jgi:hypothetical protein